MLRNYGMKTERPRDRVILVVNHVNRQFPVTAKIFPDQVMIDKDPFNLREAVLSTHND